MTKREGKIQNIIWTCLLILYPYVGVNQGLSVVDTTYSPSNFAFFPVMKGTWAVATYLANALGYVLMQLPFGDTMLGLNIYTRIVIVIMAVASWYTLKKIFPGWLVALSEIAAIGLCWAPTTILYHYLTYFFIQLASLCLIKAFSAPEGRKKWLIIAGVFLGVNVGVRMPNVTHAALILAVWYGTYLTSQNKKDIWRGLCTNTLWCICGYLPGLLLPLLAICRQFGARAYPDMICTLFAMTEKAQDYKPGAMVTGIFGGYFEGLPWMALMALCVICGSVLSVGLNRYMADKGQHQRKIIVSLFAVFYVLLLLVLFRFYWGRGMFDFRYYYYGSVYNLTVLFLWIALMVHGYVLFRPGLPEQWKILVAVSLLQVFLVPLGGNNGLYPVMNQMFLVCPATVGLLYLLLNRFNTFNFNQGGTSTLCSPCKAKPRAVRWSFVRVLNAAASGADDSGLPAVDGSPPHSVRCGKIPASFCVKAATFLTALVLLVQSVGFHACFALQDGVWGDKRNAQANANERLLGMFTTGQNAQMLDEISVYISENRLTGKKVILYGEIPGLGYILHMPSALTTFWPDLASYRVTECERDLKEAEQRITLMGMEPPVVILSAGIAAWLDDDAQAMNWFDVDADALQADEKLQMIRQFLEQYDYEQTFCNASYAVYRAHVF